MSFTIYFNEKQKKKTNAITFCLYCFFRNVKEGMYIQLKYYHFRRN